MYTGKQLTRIITAPATRRFLDFVLSPFTLLSAGWMKYFRSRNINEMPLTKRVLNTVGVFPINDHYYEPLFNAEKYLSYPLNRARILPGINLNIEEQLKLVESFKYKHELQHFPLKEEQKLQFFHNNGSFMGADAEFLYSMIRKFKPSRVIEIGCGFSTLMMQAAIRHNKGLDDSYSCRHICIEPYEFDWLEKLDIEIMRKKVEDLPLDFFKLLEENDILFIDSSHIIRPQGDVLFEYLQVLPIINKGVLVHIHDIFTPNDYLEPWIYQLNRFWNEQYLLEAFLSMNPHFHILAAVNYLHHNHKELLSQKFSGPNNDCNKEPCSFWLQRV